MSKEKPVTEPPSRMASIWLDRYITPVSPVTSTSSSTESTSQMGGIQRGGNLDSSGRDLMGFVDGEEGSSPWTPITSPSITKVEPKKETVFQEVERTVGERQLAYGSPREHWTITTGMLNALLAPYLKKPIPVSMWPRVMVLDKLARSVAGTYKHDHAVDVMGYAAGWARIEEEKDEEM